MIQKVYNEAAKLPKLKRSFSVPIPAREYFIFAPAETNRTIVRRFLFSHVWNIRRGRNILAFIIVVGINQDTREAIREYECY